MKDKIMTPKEYLNQYPNAIPEKKIDWLGFAKHYSDYVSKTKL